MIRTQFSNKIKIFRSDNAAECTYSSFITILNEDRTIPERSCLVTSQQNGHAERKHGHILDTVQAFLVSTNVPKPFWGEAALIVVYTINQVPSSTIQNQSPYEHLYGKHPDYQFLKVFGCACFVLLQPYERTRFEPQSRLYCFLACGIQHKGYKSWDPISKCLRVSHNVLFWEHKSFQACICFMSHLILHIILLIIL